MVMVLDAKLMAIGADSDASTTMPVSKYIFIRQDFRCSIGLARYDGRMIPIESTKLAQSDRG